MTKQLSDPLRLRPAVPTVNLRSEDGVIEFGGSQPVLICGPCVIEGRDHTLRHAERIASAARDAGFQFIFKSSFDKANRTSASSYRGVGIDAGLKILAEVRGEIGCPVLTDVHAPDEALAAGQVVDILQVPAFLCRQTDLLEACGQTGRVVNIKKGQFLHPADMRFAAEKVSAKASLESGPRVLLCERGSCFGYRELVVDMRSLQIMRGLGYPVVFDATHSVQRLGGELGVSGGAREFVPVLARAAIAAGVDGIFIESHENPDEAPSDGPNMLKIDDLPCLLGQLKRLWDAGVEGIGA